MLDVKVSIELRRDRGKRERLINATAHLIPFSWQGNCSCKSKSGKCISLIQTNAKERTVTLLRKVDFDDLIIISSLFLWILRLHLDLEYTYSLHDRQICFIF